MRWYTYIFAWGEYRKKREISAKIIGFEQDSNQTPHEYRSESLAPLVQKLIR
jgi:hypothetical protein